MKFVLSKVVILTVLLNKVLLLKVVLMKVVVEGFACSKLIIRPCGYLQNI